MATVAVDTETCLITDTCVAPPLVCVSIADHEGISEVYHHEEAHDVVEALLHSGDTIVGHNFAFDAVVMCAKWPDLIPDFFRAYEEDRITDTMLREKLQHIALGVYRGFANRKGKVVKLTYDLDSIVQRRLNRKLDKDTWRLRYGELIDIPVGFWPEGAVDYARIDAESTMDLWLDQEKEGREFLEDQYRQARAAFWMQLMSAWGLTTDPSKVAAFAEQVRREYDELMQELVSVGLVRANGVRDTKAARARCNQAYHKLGKAAPRSNPSKRHPRGQVKLDNDTCEQSGDPILIKYANLSSLKKKISTDIPLLSKGRIHVRWDLLKTGRTSQSPNCQNWPRKVGQRECFVASRRDEGWVLIGADYSAFELRTQAQLCTTILGASRLREALNAGFDPHLEVARRIVGLDYETAAAKKKANDHEVDMARQSGKIANFGFPGGLGVGRLRDYARKSYGVEISEEMARDLKRIWLESWPEFNDYFKWAGAQCETQFSRFKCLFSNRYMGNLSYTEACNGLYQALAADAAKSAGFLIAKACYIDTTSPLFGCRPVNFPHDEFIAEAPLDVAAEAAEELASLMKKGAEPFLPDVPTVVEPMVMEFWSKEAKPLFDADGVLQPWRDCLNCGSMKGATWVDGIGVICRECRK